MANTIEHLVVNGVTYDLLGGSGGGEERVLLWENPNLTPKSGYSFGPTTLQLPNDDYTKIGIEYSCRMATAANFNNRYYVECLLPSNSESLNHTAVNHESYVVLQSLVSNNIYLRKAKIHKTLSNLEVSFQDGMTWNTTTVQNTYSIPYRIYGVK